MTAIRFFSLLFAISFLSLSCNRENQTETDQIFPRTIHWVYSTSGTDAAQQENFDDSQWDVFYSGSADSIPLSNVVPAFRWMRFHIKGAVTPGTGRNPLIEVDGADSSLVRFFAFPASVSVQSFVTWYPGEGRFGLNLDSLLNSHPDIKLLVIENRNQSAGSPDKESGIIQTDGNPTQIIQDEQNLRLVRTIQRMDSLWIRNDIKNFSKFIHNGYSDNGVSKNDKMDFYKFTALRVEGMHFDYGNFAFFDLADGRKRLIYSYNLWKGDSLVDGGREDRYFKLSNGIWKETGNLSRFYKYVTDAKIMGGAHNNFIYLPPDYFDSPTRRYPVIYVFNDFLDHTRDWIAYRMPAMLDSSISRKLIKPTIIIFLDGGPSLYMKSAKENSYNFEDYFITMVGPNSDFTLRTIPNRENRFLTGFGQGGLASLYYLCKYPTLFSSAAAINGRFTESIRADHVDNGNSDYWADKYPSFFLNQMPDYILEKLHFILLQQTGNNQEKDFLSLSVLLREKNASAETYKFNRAWQENFPLILSKAFGGHMAPRKAR